MKIIGVRFREVGKICYYDPDDIDIDVNDRVIADRPRCGMRQSNIGAERTQ